MRRVAIGPAAPRARSADPSIPAARDRAGTRLIQADPRATSRVQRTVGAEIYGKPFRLGANSNWTQQRWRYAPSPEFPGCRYGAPPPLQSGECAQRDVPPAADGPRAPWQTSRLQGPLSRDSSSTYNNYGGIARGVYKDCCHDSRCRVRLARLPVPPLPRGGSN